MMDEIPDSYGLDGILAEALRSRAKWRAADVSVCCRYAGGGWPNKPRADSTVRMRMWMGMQIESREHTLSSG
ncbi:hypothetical protein PMIN01_08507 [Paraphaeosphaeria minitans]|uniref:Uncharacterized protein n=1 Tax=Paraphaeosphaeria minitans TaxID=565426 RepID=A0A9P6GHB8_9PLEO|nr:hypothetical protein PMIN01_08507 [Paraphaeosphaeria minitans]